MSRDKYREEVKYEAWLSGYDPDDMDDFDIDECYYACEWPDEAVRTLLGRRRDDEQME